MTIPWLRHRTNPSNYCSQDFETGVYPETFEGFLNNITAIRRYESNESRLHYVSDCLPVRSSIGGGGFVVKIRTLRSKSLLSNGALIILV